MTRAEAETIALQVQAALETVDLTPDVQLVVLLRTSGHVLIAGNGDTDMVRALLSAGMVSFAMADADGTLARVVRTVKPS